MTQAFNLAQLANNLNTSGQLDATDGLNGLVANANLASSGTASSSTFLRGDRTWATVTQKVLQVVQGTFSTNSSSTSTSYVDTGLSASITPTSTSSKILVLVSQSVFIAGSTQGMSATLNIVRNSTQIWESINQAVQTYDQGGSGVEIGASVALNYLDSPATTSSTTYKTQLLRGGGTELRWRSGTITLLEISA